MSTSLEALLKASIELAALRLQVKQLTDENARLRARVNAVRDFDVDADQYICSLLKPQAG